MGVCVCVREEREIKDSHLGVSVNMVTCGA